MSDFELSEDERKSFYKGIAKKYWDVQYLTEGWKTVHDAGGLDKTEDLAEREIDLFLWPTQEKTESLICDKENNPYPTMTGDMWKHPPLPLDLSNFVALDYGCGGLARYTASLSKYFKFVCGVDVSSEAIVMAKNRIKQRKLKNNISLSVCDGVSLSFPSNYFDFIFSNLVLQHIGNKEVLSNLASEFARTLKPGGIARLEYLDSTQKKQENFFSPVEGNGVTLEEVSSWFDKYSCKVVCHTESFPWLWITVRKG